MPEFEVIDTAEKFEEAVKERIAKETSAVEQKYAGYMSKEDVEKKYAGYISPKESAKKDAEIKGFKMKEMKVNIAINAGIPYELAGKLSGETEEDIKKDAETFAKYLKSGKSAPLSNPEPPAENNNRSAVRKMLNGLKGE